MLQLVLAVAVMRVWQPLVTVPVALSCAHIIGCTRWLSLCCSCIRFGSGRFGAAGGTDMGSQDRSQLLLVVAPVAAVANSASVLQTRSVYNPLQLLLALVADIVAIGGLMALSGAHTHIVVVVGSGSSCCKLQPLALKINLVRKHTMAEDRHLPL